MSEENIVQNAELESPTSQEPETQQEEIGGETPAAAPQEQEAPADNSAQAEGDADNPTSETPEEPFLTVQYNHEDRNLTREEAEKLARHGIYYDSMFNKLDYIAAQSDITVDTLLDNMMNALEDSKRAELAEKFGDDEGMINDLMTLYRNQQKEKYDRVLADRKNAESEAARSAEQSANERIAAEFSAMKKSYPELSDFASLPAEVKKAAMSGMSLEHAYLKHQHTENQKIAAARQTAENAAKISTGSAATDTTDSKTEDERRFLNALWGH